jgi:hypothetical protein
MRAALDDLAGNFNIGQAGIVAARFGAAAWVLRNAAGLRRVGTVLCRVPVSRPFPDITDHVVNAIAVWRERGHGRRSLEAVVVQILSRKFALPRIGLVPAAGREFVTPGILSVFQTAPCGELPFRLGRQILASPACVGKRVSERDVYNRMVVEMVDVALWPIGMPPVGALEEGPPFSPVAQIDLA